MTAYNPFSLIGKTIFVTGASSGIGKAIAIECSKMGANTIITGRNKERLSETFSSLEGENHMQIVADLCEEDDVQSLLEIVPPLDGIVHCAGIVDQRPFQFVNEENLDKIFSINFFTPALITNKLVKKKKVNKGGSIVFISSISGIYASYVAGSSYAATKGAISGMSKGMAIDLAPKKIRVNSVCPAMINTNLLDEGKLEESQLAEDMKKYPLKRYGEPQEVAFATIYLLSDAAAWVTGTNMLIDGGYTLL